MFVRLLIVTASLFLLIGCDPPAKDGNSSSSISNSNAPTPSFSPPEPIKPSSAIDPNFKVNNPYFPLVPGSTLKYTIHYASPVVANVIVVVDSAQENGRQLFAQTWQIVDTGGGDEKNENTVRRYVLDGDNVLQVYEKTQNMFRGQKTTSELKFTKEAAVMPGVSSLRPGATWSQSFTQVFQIAEEKPIVEDKTMTISYKIDGKEDVTVPAGKFKALKVIREVTGNKLPINDFYVQGVGLVKREAGDGTRLELTEYHGVKPAE